MSFLTFLTFVSALSNVAQAGHEGDVSYALQVLKELPVELASPYCSSYAGGGAAKTWTVTAAPYTVTTTLEPTACGKTKHYGQPTDLAYPGAPHEVIDVEGDYPYPDYGGKDDGPDVFVTSTTTLTYTLTSTSTSTVYPGSTDAFVVDPTGFIWPEPTDVYIDPINSDPTYANPTDAFYLDPVYNEPSADIYVDPVYADPTDAFVPLKRSAKFLFSRAQWCEDIGRPCRLMVYTDAEIADACGKYLGEAGGYQVDIDTVTVTVTVYGETATATVTPDCFTGDYHDSTDVSEYGSDSKPEHGYGGEEEGDESYGSPSYGEEEASAPWDEEGASYGDHSLEHGEESHAEGDSESHESGEHGGPPEEGKPEHGGPPTGGKPEHGGPPAEGKPEYEGGEHGGAPEEGKPEYEGAEHGGPPAEGKPEYGEEEPKPKPKMCKVKPWKK